MSESTVSVVLCNPAAGEASIPEGLIDIWPRVSALLSHWQRFNRDQTKIATQQHGMIRDGCFIMPSPFSDAPDTCFHSYHHNHRFFFEFEAAERYYWITSALDRAYSLSALYFAQRNIAVTMYDYNIDSPLIGQFARQRARLPINSRPPMPSAGQRIAVVGWPHPMHMLWNELPALDAIASTELREKLRLAVTHQPFGPTEQLFPELADSIQQLDYQDIPALNREHRFLLGLGAWTITPTVQHRVQDAARRNIGRETLQSRDTFRAKHAPIFWLSVKPPNRTCLDQSAVLATLIAAIRHEYPHAGFLLNGVSLPWDYYVNRNYQPWSRTSLHRASVASRQIIQDITGQLPAALRGDVIAVTDISLCDEVVWGEITDFYFCHGGTMQNKIGWIHRVPGMIHSNSNFLAAYQSMPTPVLDGAPCCFLPPDVTIDDDQTGYSTDELARKDQNYRFTSLVNVANAVLESFAATRSS